MKSAATAVALLSLMSAAVPAGTSDKTPNVEDLVNRVKEAYEKHCCFRATFNQLTVNVAMDMKDRFRGTICVKKPGCIALDVESPEKQKVVIRGRSYAVYFPADGSAVKGEMPPEINVEQFFGFFANIGKLDQNYQASFPNRIMSEEENLYFIELTARNNPTSTYRVVLGIDRGTFLIRRAIIYDALGNYNRFDLMGTTFLDSLADSVFRIRESVEGRPLPRATKSSADMDKK